MQKFPEKYDSYFSQSNEITEYFFVETKQLGPLINRFKFLKRCKTCPITETLTIRDNKLTLSSSISSLKFKCPKSALVFSTGN